MYGYRITLTSSVSKQVHEHRLTDNGTVMWFTCIILTCLFNPLSWSSLSLFVYYNSWWSTFRDAILSEWSSVFVIHVMLGYLFHRNTIETRKQSGRKNSLYLAAWHFNASYSSKSSPCLQWPYSQICVQQSKRHALLGKNVHSLTSLLLIISHYHRQK